jgi:hypothetical protein
VQRHTATIIQDGELVHVEVHTMPVPARQLRPRAQAHNRDTHMVDDTAGTAANPGRGCPHRPRGERAHRSV